MTHEEALLKLLAVEPETKDGLILATGWPARETLEAIRALSERHLIVRSSGYRSQGVPMYRLRVAA